MSMETGKITGESHYACREIVAERDALAARLAEAERVILRMAGEGFARAKIYVDKYDLTGEQAARATDSASVTPDLMQHCCPSVAELWVCDCGWKNIDREGVCFACQKPRATSTVPVAPEAK